MKGQERIDRMVEYINGKYSNDEFSYDHITGGHLGSNVTTIIVSSKEYPNSPIRVMCTVVDGNEVFSDTYLGIKYETETRDYLSHLMEQAFDSNSYVYYTPDDLGCTKTGSESSSFEEYIADPSSNVHFWAVVNYSPDNKTETLELLKKLLANVTVSGNIYFVEDSRTELDEDTATQIIEKNEYAVCLSIIKTDTVTYYKAEWRVGS